MHISMALYKKEVTPLLMHWSCIFLALSHWYSYAIFAQCSWNITQPVFSKIFSHETPHSFHIRVCKVMLVFCEMKMSSIFYLHHCFDICNSSHCSANQKPKWWKWVKLPDQSVIYAALSVLLLCLQCYRLSIYHCQIHHHIPQYTRKKAKTVSLDYEFPKDTS